MSTFKEIKGEDLIVETDFYLWLKEQDRLGMDLNYFIPTIQKYTNYIETPFEGRSDGQAHKNVFDVFWSHKLKK